MAASVSGDFGALRTLANEIGRLADPGFLHGLAEGLADEAVEQSNACFSESRSPMGAPWRPLNPEYRVGQPLRDTGRLQRSITGEARADAVTLATNVIYAGVHQHGATIRPVRAGMLSWKPRGSKRRYFAHQVTIAARPFFPRAGELPPAWEVAFTEVAGILVRSRLERL